MKTNKNIFWAVMLTAGLSLADSEAIYREIFSTSTNSAPLSFVGWRANTGPTGTNQPSSTALSIAFNTSSPTNLEAVNSFPANPALLATGWLYDAVTNNASPQLLWTDEIDVNLTEESITQISWRESSDAWPTAGNAAHVAICVDGKWYASSQALVRSVSGWGAVTLDFAAATWRTLNFTEGSVLSLGSETTLSGTKLESAGLYIPSLTNKLRLDTFEIQVRTKTSLFFALTGRSPQLILDADNAIPADQAAVKIETDTASPNFGKPSTTFLYYHEGFLARRNQPMDVLFIGDSITAGWQNTGAAVWNAHYANPYNAADFGISGDRTQHVLWRIENGELDGCKPKAVVLLIGTNNSAHNTPEEIAAGVTEIVNRILAKIPSTKILLLNLLPRSLNPTDARRVIVMQTNEILAGLDNGGNVRFLELWSPFLDANGILRADLMPDYLHPNLAGYEIMAEIIDGKLVTLL